MLLPAARQTGEGFQVFFVRIAMLVAPVRILAWSARIAVFKRPRQCSLQHLWGRARCLKCWVCGQAACCQTRQAARSSSFSFTHANLEQTSLTNLTFTRCGPTHTMLILVQLGYVEGCKDGNPGPIPLGLGPKQQINTRNKEPLSFVSVDICLL